MKVALKSFSSFLLTVVAACGVPSGVENENAVQGEPEDVSTAPHNDADDGVDFEGKIRNGEGAGGRYPNVGELRKRGLNYCTAFLIHPRVILTAYHCVTFGNTTMNVADLTFRLEGGAYTTVVAMRVLPVSDMAMLRLAEDKIGATQVLKVWGVRPTGLSAGMDITAIGYGVGVDANGNNVEQNSLKTGQLKFESFFQTSGDYELSFLPGKRNQLVCRGDSGGPLLFKGVAVSLNTVTFGGNTGRSDCRTATSAGGPALYSNRAWIQESFRALTNATLALHTPAPPPPPRPPATPSSFTATALNLSVALSWTAVNTATSYTVTRDTNTAGTYATVVCSGRNTSTCTDTSALSPGTTYYYRVVAVNAGGASSARSASATLLPVRPEGDLAPSRVAIQINTDGSALLTAIINSRGEIGFRTTLMYGSSSAGPLPAVMLISGRSNTRFFTVLIPADKLRRGSMSASVTAFYTTTGLELNPTDLTSTVVNFTVP